MARRKKVATLKKRDKSKPMAYVDKKGNVRHFKGGRRSKGGKKATILQKNVVSAKLLKQRKAKGKKGILLFVKGKGVFQVARKLRRGKGKRRKAKGRKRSVRRRAKGKRKSGRRRRRIRKLKKSRRCPKTRGSRSLRAARACVRAGKGRTAVKRRVFNLAVRRLRKSKAGRAFLRKSKVKMAKGVRKARKKSHRKSRRRR